MTMSDRLAVMRHGRIEQTGAPEEVYEHPATPFVASFLGASNLLVGEMKAESNGLRPRSSPRGATSVRADTAAIPPGLTGAVQVGVRPEKITLVQQDGSPPTDRNHVSGVIRMSTYIGVNYQYEVEGPGGTSSVCTCRTSAPRARIRTRATRSASSGCPSTRSWSNRLARPSRRRVNEPQARCRSVGSRVDPRDDPTPDVPARPLPLRGSGRRRARPVLDPRGLRRRAARQQTDRPDGPVRRARPSGGRQQARAGDLINFTNWPAYIDRDFSIDGPGSRPSLFEFIQATGIDVTYRADINSNEEFYAAIRPALESRAGHRARHHRDHERPGAHRDDPARLPDRARPDAAGRTSTPTSARRSRTRRTTRATSTRWPGSRG